MIVLFVVYSIILMALDIFQHSPRLMTAMNSMVQQQIAMISQSEKLAAQNATLIEQTAAMVARISALEQVVIGRRPSGDWVCHPSRVSKIEMLLG